MLYLTSDHLPIFLPLGIIGFYRYLWYLIRFVAYLTYRPILPPERPTYRAEEDVTIIVPTIDAEDGFLEAAHSWLVGNPKEIIIVTAEHMRSALEAFALRIDPHNPGRVRVLTVAQANKRRQMSEGIKACRTDIIVFADDDAIWPPTLLQYVLACFEDQSIGGVGTSQRVQPLGARMTVWEVLAAMRLSIRNIEIAASTRIDGGIPCLSGRTAAYRSLILKDPAFLDGFCNDFWLGKYHLNSGDDKFLTRWLVSHGWNTYVQCCPEAELLSTMKPNWRFLLQVLRWTRNTWRSDLRSIFMERYVWTRHPYVAYMMIDKFLNPITLLLGPCLVVYLCVKSGYKSNDPDSYRLPVWNILMSWLGWLILTRALKLGPHFYRRPQDVIYVPAWLLFGYYFAVMKVYSLFTLHETGWGTRALGNTAAPEISADKNATPSKTDSGTHDSRELAIPAGAVPPNFFDRDEQKSLYYMEKGNYANEHDEANKSTGYELHSDDRVYYDDDEEEGGYYYYDEDEGGMSKLQYPHPSHPEPEKWTEIDPNQHYQGSEGFVIYHDYLPRLGKTPDLERQRRGERRGTIKVY